MEDQRKVILVTGSSRGIGAATISGFAEKGYRVIINYSKSQKEAEELYNFIVKKYGKDSAFVMQADIYKRSEVKQLFNYSYEKFGKVDILINNAGINNDQPFLEMSDEKWSSVINTILTGTFICSQEYALRFNGKDGNIINIGALTAIGGRKNGANYCSARAGVLTLTKCMAQELAPKIRVNCVTPGWINTDEVMERYNLYQPENLEQALASIPLKKLGTPEDIFKMIYFIVEESNYLTGQNFIVDGGKLMR